MKNILCPVDSADHTNKVLEMAAVMAEKFNAKLWIIHVAAPNPDFVGHEIGPQYQRDWIATKLHEEHKYMQKHSEELRERGIDVTPLLIQGSTVETILEEMEKLKIDLVVMGSHGHGAFYSLLVESVSIEVIKKTQCPVLIVPLKM